jgi:hypothetical protein
MSRDDLTPFKGGKNDFPQYYRNFCMWIAGHRDHAKIQHLLTRNPDGYQTAAKMVVLEALASDQEVTQLTKDCPTAVGLVSAAAKLELEARKNIYQGMLFHLLWVKFNHIETEYHGVHDQTDEKCGEALLKTLLKWARVSSEKNMDKALKLV